LKGKRQRASRLICDNQSQEHYQSQLW